LQPSRCDALRNTDSTSRAGSPLLFGLAPRGVFRASDVATGAVGSYPTFSPLPMRNREAVSANKARYGKTSRRFFLRDVTELLRRRYLLCGTFRERIAWHELRSPAGQPAPLALPGALPFTLTRHKAGQSHPRTRKGSKAFSSPALASLRRWCPDFPPGPIQHRAQ
jgi:hypothetical protein